MRTEPSAYFVGVRVRDRVLDRLADREAERARARGVGGEHRAARVRVGARRGDHLRPPRLHHVAPVRLLVVADAHHVDLHVDAEELPGERERAAPLAGARLRRDPLHAGFLVVEGLRDRGVRLVAAGGAHSLVLVVDLRRRAERLLEAVRAIERRRPPQLVDVTHGPGDLDPALARHLLLDERHREERGEVGRADRLLRPGVEHRGELERHVRLDVVPGRRDLGLGQDELRRVAHGWPPGRKRRF